MLHLRWFIAVLVFVSAGALSHAQEEEKPANDQDKDATRKLLLKAEDEYRSYFKKPESVIEHWAAVKFEIDVLRCCFCGMCEEACPKDAIKLSNIYEMSTTHHQVFDKQFLLEQRGNK